MCWLKTAVLLAAPHWLPAVTTREIASLQQQKAPAAALPTVTVSQPVRREIVEWDEYTGRFDSIETVEIRARVSGYLNEVHFKDGQNVKQGDLLFVIDPRPFERALEQAQAELLQATTKVAERQSRRGARPAAGGAAASSRRRPSTTARTWCATRRRR